MKPLLQLMEMSLEAGTCVTQEACCAVTQQQGTWGVAALFNAY